jgi:hypothetical protein
MSVLNLGYRLSLTKKSHAFPDLQCVADKHNDL